VTAAALRKAPSFLGSLWFLQLLFFAALAALLCAPAARSQTAPPRTEAGKQPTRRFALVVGANDGGLQRVRLRYAGADAQAMARVLQQLGGVSPQDLTVLLEPGRAQLEAALRSLSPRLAQARPAAGRVELIVYYSGHSDEEALLPRGERFAYPELRAALDQLPADVRVTILDSCASGALTRQKGGKVRPPFLLDDASTVKGQAILTSASADEAAQESDRIGGSYFTQALLTGLRGAADTQRSGRVTLNDAYQYAFAETLARTERTQAGPQHPAYELQLAGSGDLVMTDLRSTSAGLVLPAELKGRVMVRDGAERLVVELRKPAGRVIDLGLEPGEVRITVDDGGALGETRLLLADGKKVELDPRTFTPVSRELAQARGDLPASSSQFLPDPSLSSEGPGPRQFSVGLMPGDTDAVDNSFALNLGVGRYRTLHGLDFGLGGSMYLGYVHGVQANVGISWADGEARGLQLAAGLTFTGGNLTGMQGAAGISVVRGQVRGLQGATFVSLAGSVHGLQSASGASMTQGELHGFQGAGGAALVKGELHGFQGAGGIAWTGAEGKGFQGAGLAAYATGRFTGAQLSGLASIGRAEVLGFQAAGLVDWAGELQGAQLSLVNVAGKATGSTQLGLVNVSDDAAVTIGLVSWASKGQHHLTLTGSELGPTLEGKLGGTAVYTVYIAGYTPGNRQRLRAGLGLGAHFDLTDKLFLELEGLCERVFQDGDFGGDNVLAVGRAQLGYRAFGELAIVAGPSWNTYVAWDEKVRDFGYGSVAVSSGGGHSVRNWPGVSAGIQF
jgi:Caspase domain